MLGINYKTTKTTKIVVYCYNGGNLVDNNPFVIWGEKPGNIINRKKEIKTVNTYLNAVLSGQKVGIAVRGGPGSGKSLFLKKIKQDAEKKGFFCIFVNVSKGDSYPSLVNKIKVSSEAEASTFSAEGKINAAVQEKIKKTETGGRDFFLRKIKKETCPPLYGILVFLDDIDYAKGNTLNRLVNEISENSENISAIVSSVGKTETGEFFREVVLEPFSLRDAEELVKKAVEKKSTKMGSGCTEAIFRESGGNPKLFKLACWYLYEKMKGRVKMITKGHYLAYLPAIMNFLAAEVFNLLYSRTSESERKLLEVMAGKKEINVSEIAELRGKKLGGVTSLVMRLVEKGQIKKISRGRYSVYSGLYGRYILSLGGG